METWLPTIWAVAVSVLGVLVAVWFGKRSAPWRIAAYGVGFLIMVIFAVERFTIGLELVPPFSWVAAGASREILSALVGPLLLLTPAVALPRRRDRIMVGIFAGLFSLRMVVLPSLLAVLARSTLAALPTKIDPDGVCIQQTAYTCGAASAVTALRKLGFAADEGPMAIWSFTSRFGTTPDELACALQSHYAGKGLIVRYHRFKSVGELREFPFTLAVVKYGALTDHFVTVLSVTDTTVVVGDPLSGRVESTYDEFAKQWRFYGIVMERKKGNGIIGKGAAQFLGR